MLIALLLALPVLSAQAAAAPPGGVVSGAAADPAALAFGAVLEEVLAPCAYRVRDASWFQDWPAESDAVSRSIRAVAADFTEHGTLPTCASLREAWEALGPPRGNAPPAAPRVRELFVTSSPALVIQAYHNDAQELDVTTLWTPDVLLEYNPGRHQIAFTPAGDGSQLLGLEELHFPCRMGLDLGLPCRVGPGRRGGERYVFERAELLLVVEVQQRRPVHALLVDRDQAVIAAELGYEASLAGGQVLTRVNRIDAFRTTSGLQLQISERALSETDPARAPGPIEVHAHDNLFLFSPEGGSEFRGRVDTREIPALIRPLLRVSESPRPVWSL